MIHQMNDWLVDILRCPVCEDRPRVESRDGSLVCSKCGRVYDVRDGIPDMVAGRNEEAEDNEDTGD